VTASTERGRVHLVLVPGFGGFDALGGLEYYAGTTECMREWLTNTFETGPAEPVLHYFDNFPTAGVTTRAALLREFLAKRIARNEVQRHDSFVLIGHSTGGLDIRQLICDLTGTGARGTSPGVGVDGSQRSAIHIQNAELRRRIRRVVFLSVPQRGTNIANWVRGFGGARRVFFGLLSTLIDAADVPGLESIDLGLARFVTRPLLDSAKRPCGLAAAIADVQLEMAERNSRDPLRAAKARQAHANVNLWLSHVENDFLAINDLAYGEDDTGTPARFSADRRLAEQSAWKESAEWPAITARSYLTLGRCPFDQNWQKRQDESPGGALAKALAAVKDRLEDAWDLLGRGEQSGKSDLAYRLAYQICANGPFQAQPGASANEFGSRKLVPLNSWQNDGIVNTASMLWPEGETLIVHADHGDIIGHFEFAKSPAGQSGREYHTYDILESSSAAGGREFGPGEFKAIWNDIFDFAVLEV
jgi:hypothetical protein